ncbi:hypothetical protein BGZ94_008911 [Podila epigama]|nr:hypothetical protein BGZ94_008911 [Podila epigama]
MAAVTTGAVPTATPTSTSPLGGADPKGDFALFGKPSVVGSFNLTSGILIYSVFLILFIGSIGSATWQRSRYRNQFRQQQRLMNAESGRTAPGKGNKSSTDDSELSDAALFKQASISKRALMQDVGPGGVMAANEAIKTKIAAANGAGRSFDDRDAGHQVRFGDAPSGTNASSSGTGRTGGMKKTPARSNSGNRGQDLNQGYEMNTYGQYYENNSHNNNDTTDYSRPPLTESSDPYYSSGSSHSGYLDQADEHYYNDGSNNYPPQAPRPAYNPRSPQMNGASNSPQPHYQQALFVQRSNSSRMPQNDMHDSNNVYRSNSGQGGHGGSPHIPSRSLERAGSNPSRIATQGVVDRAGSGGRSRSHSPIDGGMGGSSASSSRTRVAPSPTQTHPTPIARSNSTRLPPQMRGGTPQPGPSGLSQQTNNYDSR